MLRNKSTVWDKSIKLTKFNYVYVLFLVVLLRRKRRLSKLQGKLAYTSWYGKCLKPM